MPQRGSRLLPAFAGAALLTVAGLLLWAMSIASSWNSTCPQLGGGYEPVGLDKGISLLPPGAACAGGSDGLYWFEAHPRMWSVARGLLVCAALVVLIGVIADTQARRRSTPISSSTL